MALTPHLRRIPAELHQTAQADSVHLRAVAAALSAVSAHHPHPAAAHLHVPALAVLPAAADSAHHPEAVAVPSAAAAAEAAVAHSENKKQYNICVFKTALVCAVFF